MIMTSDHHFEFGSVNNSNSLNTRFCKLTVSCEPKMTMQEFHLA
jgi:hypothetical protein